MKRVTTRWIVGVASLLVMPWQPALAQRQEPPEQRSLVGGAWVSSAAGGEALILVFKKDYTFELRVVNQQRQVVKSHTGKYRYHDGEWTLNFGGQEYRAKVVWVSDDELLTTESDGAKSRWHRCKKRNR